MLPKSATIALSSIATMTTMAVHQTQEVGFEDLSGELRNKIYEYALVRENVDLLVDYKTNDPDGGDGVPHVLQEPPLLMTSRQIRAEGLSIFYGNNVFLGSFISDNTVALTRFLKRLGGKMAMLKKVHLQIAIHDMRDNPIRYIRLHSAMIEDCMVKFGGQGLRRDALFAPTFVDGDLVWLNLPCDKVVEKSGRFLSWKTAIVDETT